MPSSPYPVSENLALVLARIFISYLFINAGWDKIMHFQQAVTYITSHNLPLGEVLAILAIIVELGGGLLVLLGWRARLGALALFIFVILVTFTFHSFWTMGPDEAQNQMQHFLKNTAIAGGLLYVIVFGAGRWSLGRKSATL